MSTDKSNYTDKTLTCRDCGTNFVFTAGAQAFHAEKGFTNTPSRCIPCREVRKAQGSGVRREFGSAPREFSGSRERTGEREMHEATCTACGKPCQVPFRPSGEKPVFCYDCFQRQRGESRPPRSNRW